MTSTALKHQARLREWGAAVQECRSSGVSVRQWCRERGITPTTYYRWEREVLSMANTEREAAKEKTVTFAGLPAPGQRSRNVAERAATIRIGEASIDIYDEVSAGLLKVMVEVLRSC